MDPMGLDLFSLLVWADILGPNETGAFGRSNLTDPPQGAGRRRSRYHSISDGHGRSEEDVSGAAQLSQKEL